MANEEDPESIDFTFPGIVETFTITERPERGYYIEVFDGHRKLTGVCGFTCPDGMAFQIYKASIYVVTVEFHQLPEKPAPDA